jgi:Cu/Ag efflux protein CusF
MPTTAKIAACAALALSLACRDAAPERAAPPPGRYTVRGEVVRVGARELSIRHEPIPDFADRSGAVVGMSAMVMPFPVAERVSLAGLVPGAKIRFTFVMDWERNRMEIDRLEPLPADTALRFEAH